MKSKAAWQSISEQIGPVTTTHPLGGGDINSAYRLETESGEQLFAKFNRESLLLFPNLPP